jgi:hypothetical protein
MEKITRVVTIGLYSETINHLWTKKRNPDRWEYKRPHGDSGIRDMTIYWKGNRAEFEIHIDKVEMGNPSQWPNPVPIMLQIGDDDRGGTTVKMREWRNQWLYNK